MDGVNNDELKLDKVHTGANLADLMTKHLKREDKDKLMGKLGYELREGRADQSLRISQLGADAWISKRSSVAVQNPPGCQDCHIDKKRNLIMPIIQNVRMSEKEINEDEQREILQEVLRVGAWVRAHRPRDKSCSLFSKLPEALLKPIM